MICIYSKTLLLAFGLTAISGVQADNLIQAVHEGDIEPLKIMLNVANDINQLGGSWTEHGSTKMYFIRGSALHYAVHQGREDLVRLLINHGATIDVRDENDFTPLHSAAWAGNLGMVKLLIESGADVQASNRFEDTPLSRALDNNRTEVVEYIRGRLQ